MSQKIYKSAMGRIVDMGALMLENENTRAVGNMKVNARGDKLDVSNRVTETRNKQVQKHYQRQVGNTSEQLPTTSTKAAKKQYSQKKAAMEKVVKNTDIPSTSRNQLVKEKVVNDSVLDAYNNERLVSKHDKIQAAQSALAEIPEIDSLEELAALESASLELIAHPEPIEEVVDPVVPRGGLAAAIARSKTLKQELVQTQRNLVQNKPGVNKI
jgi:hypothetical protein